MGLAASFQPLPLTAAALYRSRNVRATALYQLLESYFEDVKTVWDERFENRYGYWRGFVDTVVARYLDYGVEEAGFARLRCDTCGEENKKIPDGVSSSFPTALSARGVDRRDVGWLTAVARNAPQPSHFSENDGAVLEPNAEGPLAAVPMPLAFAWAGPR